MRSESGADRSEQPSPDVGVDLKLGCTCPVADCPGEVVSELSEETEVSVLYVGRCDVCRRTFNVVMIKEPDLGWQEA